MCIQDPGRQPTSSESVPVVCRAISEGFMEVTMAASIICALSHSVSVAAYSATSSLDSGACTLDPT